MVAGETTEAEAKKVVVMGEEAIANEKAASAKVSTLNATVRVRTQSTIAGTTYRFGTCLSYNKPILRPQPSPSPPSPPGHQGRV